MLRGFSIVNRYKRYLKLLCPRSDINLMYERGHADEASAMDVENKFFRDVFWL
jgi:hypothetical protein